MPEMREETAGGPGKTGRTEGEKRIEGKYRSQLRDTMREENCKIYRHSRGFSLTLCPRGSIIR